MSTLQIRVDDTLKKRAESLFSSLGLDTSTAIRIFLNASIEYNGIPFAVKHKTIPPSLMEAVQDSRMRKNLKGPFDSADAAVSSMLEDM